MKVKDSHVINHRFIPFSDIPGSKKGKKFRKKRSIQIYPFFKQGMSQDGQKKESLDLSLL